jgi:hypothetical protein
MARCTYTHLTAAFQLMPSLRKRALSGTRVQDAGGVASLLQAASKSLQSLDRKHLFDSLLSKGGDDRVATEALASAIGSLVNLTSIDLPGCLEKASGVLVLQTMKQCPKLKEFIFFDLRPTGPSITDIVQTLDGLFGCTPDLERLTLNCDIEGI